MTSILTLVMLIYALIGMAVAGIIIYLILKRVKEKEGENFGGRSN